MRIVTGKLEVTQSPIASESLREAFMAALRSEPTQPDGWWSLEEFCEATGYTQGSAEKKFLRAFRAGKLKRMRAICKDGKARFVYSPETK